VKYVNAIMFAKILGGGNCPVCPFLVAALGCTVTKIVEGHWSRTHVSNWWPAKSFYEAREVQILSHNLLIFLEL